MLEIGLSLSSLSCGPFHEYISTATESVYIGCFGAGAETTVDIRNCVVSIVSNKPSMHLLILFIPTITPYTGCAKCPLLITTSCMKADTTTSALSLFKMFHPYSDDECRACTVQEHTACNRRYMTQMNMLHSKRKDEQHDYDK